MRNVLFTLLFANLAYFAWSHWVDTPRPPPVNESIARLPRLKLANEPLAPQPAADTAEKTALNGSPGCMSVGPFEDIANTTRVASLLRVKGLDPRQRAETGGTSQEYWVYVGGMKSDDDANRVLRSLQRLGFKDSQIMPDGGDPGRRVSLGVFNERGGADQRAWAARLKGFNADITERKLPGTLYWLDFVPLAGMSSVPIQELLAGGVSSRIAVQPCPAPLPPKPTSAAVTPAHQPTTAGISKVP